jgi:hypothetical protein
MADTPRQPSSMAAVNPTGPPPTINTVASIFLSMRQLPSKSKKYGLKLNGI